MCLVGDTIAMTAIRSVDSFKYGARLFAYLLVVVLVGGGLLGLGWEIGYSDAQALLDSSGYNSAELAGGAVLAALGGFVLLTGLFGLVHKLIADSVTAGQPDTKSAADSPAETADETSQSPDSTADDDTAAQTGPSPGEQAARDHGHTQTVPAGDTAGPPEQTEPPAPTPPAESSELPGQPTTEAETGSEPAESQPSTAADSKSSQESDEQSDDWASELEFPARKSQSETQTTETAETDTTSRTAGDEAVDSSETHDEPPEQPRPEPSPEEIAFGTNLQDDEESTDELEVSDEDGEEEEDEKEDSEGLTSYDELDEGASSVESAGDSSASDPLADPNDE